MISQTEKSVLLEHAVINKSPSELAEFYHELGYVEFSARALGTACRFCGAEAVRALAECGAAFSITKTEDTEKCYHVYSGMKYDNYRSNFALYLLNITKQIKGACCCKGLKLSKQAEREDKTKLKQLPDSERAEVLKYLCQNKDTLSFEPSELLYYAIFARDDFIVSELKKLGVKLSETRIEIITKGGMSTNSHWYEYCSMTKKLDSENYLPVMKRLYDEFDGKQFHCTEKVFETTKERFSNSQIAEFFFEKFNLDRLNKLNILYQTIDHNAVSVLPLAEKAGWLANTKRRDRLIEYAQTNNNIECTAWLMDFKNSTADLAAEREKAEKKMQRELNASPNSVLMLKKIWSCKKQEDGTLIITNYKGSSTEVTVPETIGKSTVTVIGNGAFATVSGRGGEVFTNATREQIANRLKITKVTFPKTLKKIDIGAFDTAIALKEVEIPDGVEEISDFAFYECRSLTRMIIPGSVKRIGKFAIAYCKNLREIIIRDGVEEIDKCAFTNNDNLRRIEIPASVKILHEADYVLTDVCGILGYKSSACVVCPKGSEAEKHCIKFRYKAK